MLALKKRAVREAVRADTPETITAAIAEAEAEAREAGAEAARQAELAGQSLDDDQAEAAEARSRSEDRRRRRAEARVAELREAMAAARWHERDRAFRRHQRELAKLTRQVMDTMAVATEATLALVKARQAAIAEVGNDISIAPAPFLGIPMPDLFERWRRRAESQLEALASASLPPPPPVPGAAPAVQAIPVTPRPPVAAAPRPVPVPVAEAAPPPRPRAFRRDPPPGAGERQVHILRIGDIDMPDGTRVGQGDRVNFPEAKARRLLELGIANYVKFDTAPEPVLVSEGAAAT